MEDDPVLIGSCFRTDKLTAVSSRRPPQSLSFTIEFQFSGESTLFHQDDEASRTFSMTSTVAMNLRQFLCRKESQSIIGRSTREWPVWGNARRNFIDFSLSQAKLAVKSMPAGHNQVNMHIHFTATHFYETPDSGVIDSSLEMTEVTTGICSVCLEEFIDGDSNGVKTPCGHVFHQHCIRKWLRISHYCPNCRFQMPTKENM